MKLNDSPQINAQFWDELFTKGTMPWDRNSTPEDLHQFLLANGVDAESETKPMVFIPGCGAGYEVVSFIKADYQVTAMDYSLQAVNLAKQQLGQYGDVVVHGDVFEAQFASPFNVIYERAFLAALPREKWTDYFTMLERLLPSGGLLIGYFVISDDYRSRFPPFCLRSGELTQWLSSSFNLLSCSRVEDSVAVFADKEYWMVWQKN